MLHGFVFAFQRIHMNRLFKKKKKKHDVASYPLTYEQKTMILRSISVDLGTVIQFFSSNDVVIFVHLYIVLFCCC